MAKVKLRATGGLNKDVDPNFLPEGDYIEASNIVTDTSTSGNAGSIKMLESIKATGVSFSGNIKATCQDPDGNIYVLERVDGTDASIHKLVSPFTSKTTIVTYPHSVSTDFSPDLKILGDVLMWNYHLEGTPLSFKLDSASTSNIDSLKLQKITPNNVVTISKHKTTDAGVGTLEINDYQFAFRYLYASGEYSALSAYTQMYKAEPDTDYYTFSFSFTGAPTFASKLETFAREGNNGAWRRIDTRPLTDTTALNWNGAMYDALDTVSSNKPFDAIPVDAKHLEVAKNRLFLANVLDDYPVTPDNLLIDIATTGSGYTPSTGGDKLLYGSSSYTNPTSTETANGSGYVKPFANNSTYAFGFAYYDKAMKTRGVEKYVNYTTPSLSVTNFAPSITLTPQAGYDAPDWAEYIQVVYTKNLSKLYSYEGYASNIFFRVNRTIKNPETGEDEQRIFDVQNLEQDDLDNSPVLILDLMSMFAGGHIYNYSDGDIITLNMIDYSIGANENVRVNLNVIGQEGSFVICEYNGGVIQTVGTAGIPEPEKLFFEIYTPKQQQESESYVFFEYGNLIDISTWKSSPTTITLAADSSFDRKIIGDMVWKVVEAGTYETRPFFKTSQKATPIEDNITDATTIVNGSIGTVSTSSVIVDLGGEEDITKESLKEKVVLSLSATNEDNAEIPTGTGLFQVSGFYDAGRQTQGTDKITLDFSVQIQTYCELPTNSTGNMTTYVYAQLYRIPFDNERNKRLQAEEFSQVYEIAYRDIASASNNNLWNYTPTFEIDLNTKGVDIAASDQFTIKVWAETEISGAMFNGYVIVGDYNSKFVTMTLSGNRITPKDYPVRDTNAKVNATKAKFLMRAISNSISNPIWHTSAGKTSISASDIISERRTNTIRYSGQYIAGTKINDLNSFFALDSADLPVENGDIMALHRASRLQGNGDMLLALCKRESSYILLGEQDITQASNAPLRALTANFIGTIRNVGGNLGLQEKLSAINYKGTIYWWDDFNKKVVKFSKDGIELLSDKFMKSYFRGKSGSARLCYDPFYNIINIGFTSDSISTGYSEVLERWVSDYSFRTDFSESYGDRMILFKGTAVYRSLESNSGTDYNGFLGASQVNSTIKFVMNSQIPVQPLNVSVQHNCNVIDYAQSNGVKASLLTIGIDNENGQATSIVESNFLLENNRLYAHVLRDSNSPNGIIAGDHIVGYINKFLLTLKDRSQAMNINSIDVEVDNVSGHS